MAGLRWYAHYLDDYRRDTGHLSMIEDGAYRRLLDEIYVLGKPLPVSLTAVHRLARAFSEEERAAVDSILAQFFQSTPEGFVQKRARLELEKSQDINKKRAAASEASRASRSRPREVNDPANGPPDASPHGAANGHANGEAFASTITTTHTKRLNNQSLMGNGLGSGVYARETIKDPDQRIARFQSKLATQLGKDGWTIIFAATNAKDPNHVSALRACKAAAKAIGKGWPLNWPVAA